MALQTVGEIEVVHDLPSKMEAVLAATRMIGTPMENPRDAWAALATLSTLLEPSIEDVLVDAEGDFIAALDLPGQDSTPQHYLVVGSVTYLGTGSADTAFSGPRALDKPGREDEYPRVYYRGNNGELIRRVNNRNSAEGRMFDIQVRKGLARLVQIRRGQTYNAQEALDTGASEKFYFSGTSLYANPFNTYDSDAVNAADIAYTKAEEKREAMNRALFGEPEKYTHFENSPHGRNLNAIAGEMFNAQNHHTYDISLKAQDGITVAVNEMLNQLRYNDRVGIEAFKTALENTVVSKYLRDANLQVIVCEDPKGGILLSFEYLNPKTSRLTQLLSIVAQDRDDIFNNLGNLQSSFKGSAIISPTLYLEHNRGIADVIGGYMGASFTQPKKESIRPNMSKKSASGVRRIMGNLFGNNKASQSPAFASVARHDNDYVPLYKSQLGESNVRTYGRQDNLYSQAA